MKALTSLSYAAFFSITEVLVPNADMNDVDSLMQYFADLCPPEHARNFRGLSVVDKTWVYVNFTVELARDQFVAWVNDPNDTFQLGMGTVARTIRRARDAGLFKEDDLPF